MSAVPRTREALLAWLVTAVARELHMREADIDPARPLAFYGLDSLTAAGLAGELEDWLGRPLPPDVLREHGTIASIASLLAVASATDTPAPAPPMPARATPPVPVQLSLQRYARWTRTQASLRAIVAGLVRVTSRVEVHGAELVPDEGPALITCNHLHILDACWIAAVLRRRVVFFVAGEFERRFLVGALLRAAGSIFVARGGADREALARAVAALREGAALVIAPEGRLSRTGGLIEGQPGIAYLATETGAPIVPVVAWGQERAGWSWRRLRRVPVQIRAGQPFALPQGRATARELQAYTEQVMKSLAALLPPAYRGLYGAQ